MKVKVCGIRNPDDLRALARLEVDFIGFIFHEPSKRHVRSAMDELSKINLNENIGRVGVFLNEPEIKVIETCRKFQLSYAQLHGAESADDCSAVRKYVKVIKAFNLDDSFNFTQLAAYDEACDYFLFDAKGEYAGGNGIAYDWNILQRYELDKPFFLSGGIKPEHAEQLQSFHHPAWFAIDINSGFEKSPGEKDVNVIRKFIRQLKQAA